MEGDSTPILLLEPAEPVGSAYYQVFQQKTVIATVIIVLIGSVATYFAAGYSKFVLMNSFSVRRNAVSWLA